MNMAMSKTVKIILILLGGGFLVGIWSIYRKPFKETPCADIPKGSVVFATAFLNLGEKNGTIIPGQANIQMANKLEECADRFSLVLTQKAISDALANPNALGNGTPVFQMHDHNPNIEVRTFAAFRCALERFKSAPDRLVLMAHPKHHQRALMDLKAVYEGDIVNLYLGDVLYEDEHWSRPFQWASKNMFGWFVDRLLILSIEHPTFARLGPFLERLHVAKDCPIGVQLPKIVEKDGRWMTEPN